MSTPPEQPSGNLPKYATFNYDKYTIREAYPSKNEQVFPLTAVSRIEQPFFVDVQCDQCGCMMSGSVTHIPGMIIKELFSFLHCNRYIKVIRDHDGLATITVNVLEYRFPWKSLELVEAYAYYDQPVLFSCKTNDGRVYLAISLETKPSADVWLYARISKSRTLDIVSGKIDLFTEFRWAEDGFVYKVTCSSDMPVAGMGKELDRNAKGPSWETVSVDDLTQDMLPLPGQRLGKS